MANPFHFVIASLPSPDAIGAFRAYAFNYITGSTNTLSFNPSTSQVGLTINITTQNVDAESTQKGALLQVYPLQYDNFDQATTSALASLYLTDPSLAANPSLPPADTYFTLSTSFGNTRLLRAATVSSGNTDTSTMSYSLAYDGSLSILPEGAFVSSDQNDTPSATTDDVTQEKQLIDSLLENINVNQVLTVTGQGNTYVWGQEFQKLTSLIPVADQLGLTSERDMLLEMVESEMTQWFNARPQRPQWRCRPGTRL